MKRYALLGTVTALICALMLLLPGLAERSLPTVGVVPLSQVFHQDTVSASGYLTDPNQTQITCTLPLVPDQVLVRTGDRVQTGETIATVDIPKTQQALIQLLDLAEVLPEETVSAMAGLEDQEHLKLLSSLIPQTIAANQDGIVTSLNLSSGMLLYPSENAATISSGTILEACLQVPEEYAAQIQTGQAVTLTAAAQEQTELSGTVTAVAPAAQTVFSGSSQETVVDVTVSLTESTGMKSGYSVKGKIQVSPLQLCWVLPYEAVAQDDQGQEYVYCLQGNRAVRQDVQTGEELAEGVQILSGISQDDWVAADWTQIRESGQRIRPRAEEAAA